MGNEAKCHVRAGGRTETGRALLETAELIFRPAEKGGLRLAIPFAGAKATAKGSALTIAHAGGTAVFELGDAALAAKWAAKIANPPSLLAKLGVKPGLSIVVLGVDDASFAAALRDAGVAVATRAGKGADLIFFAANRTGDLATLARLKESLAPTGAIWVVRPKGVKEITEAQVLAAGKAAGLVDVKVAAFSATHTAEKLVIPVAARRG